MKITRIVLEKDTIKVTFRFYPEHRIVEMEEYNEENPYYWYYESDDTLIEENKPIYQRFKSFKKGWEEIRKYQNEGFEITKKITEIL